MAIIKCKMCGGDLDVIPCSTVAECEYCGSRQTVPAADNEKKLTLFARANRLRAACEFDKAAGIYESIVADFPDEAEAYWGLVLCKYGIEYVDDPATGKKIPTCHRSSFDSVMDDSNFEQALENADALARKVYRDESKQIEEIREGIVAVSSSEAPYDIFICYKETDESGERTLDSVLAQDIYDALTTKGYRTFFARITLEDKLGIEYEPYIFAALNSAKIMLAVGTEYEYYNAVWVKNEWSRYLKLMAQDKSKHLIPCFKGIDAYDMPKEFARLQAQDLGKVGAMQDLLRGIEKILPKQQPELTTKETVVIRETAQNAASPTVVSLLKRMQLFLEDCDWQSAKEYANKVLDADPECAEAYFGLAMCEDEICSMDALVKKRNWESAHYSRGKRFASGALLKQINMLEQTLISREEARIAQEKLEEKARMAQEKAMQEARIAAEQDSPATIARLAPLQKRARLVAGMISAGDYHTIGTKSNGTVVATKFTAHPDNYDGQCDVSGWADIVAVAGNDSHSIGLKADGTVVATKYIGDSEYYHGQCEVTGWRDIVAIATADTHTVGLKADGTVVATRYIGDSYVDQCEVSHWTDIVAIAAAPGHTVGLKADGTVVAAGYAPYGACAVSEWRDIVAIVTSEDHTVGLKSNGTVVATKYTGSSDLYDGQCEVSGWADIVAIAASWCHTVGLKSDGTMVAVGHNGVGRCAVFTWKDIVAIAADDHHTVGLKADGTVVATKFTGEADYYCGQCEVSDWKLFSSLSELEQKRMPLVHKLEEHRSEAAERSRKAERRRVEAEQWRAAGKCQYCGGAFKGLFGKKCADCSKPKDY